MARKTLKELQRKCSNLRRTRKNQGELCESLVDLASLYQEKDAYDDAVDSCNEAISLLESVNNDIKRCKLAFAAYRCLSEVYATEGKGEEALFNSGKCRKAATLSGNHSYIQLSLHVSAWVLEKLWVVSGSIYVTYLEQAYDFAKKALDYLDVHGSKIDRDTETVATYESVEYRRANLERLLSGLAGNLDKRSEAEKYLKCAMNFAKKKNLPDLRYELQIAQLDFSWVDKKKLAQILVNEAPAKRKCGAKLEQSQVLIYCGDMERAFDVLLDIMAQNQSELSPEDLELLRSRIVFVYKFVKALKRCRDENIGVEERRKMYEQMGDWILDYSSNTRDTLRLAVSFYTKMLTYSFTEREKIPALISLGQTYFDLQMYADAVKYFEKCLEYEILINTKLKKRLSTRILIFDSKCKGSLASVGELVESLKLLLEDIPIYDTQAKSDRCRVMSEFLASNGDALSLYYAEKADEYERNIVNNVGKDETPETESASTNLEDTVAINANILMKCERLARLRNEVSHIEKRKNWRNNHGETELHLEAKGDNTGRLKLLLQHGYNVNSRDNSGWTPLHEAVNHKKVTHVKILLSAGARVDAVSNVGDDGGLDDGRIGGRITPLMDACANLVEGEEMLEIAELLYKQDPKFVTLKNEDGWTAVDFLSDSMKRLESDSEANFVSRAKKLLIAMKNQFGKEGIVYTVAPAIHRIKRKSSEGRRPMDKTSGRMDGVSVYQKAMSSIGSRAKRSCDNHNCSRESDSDGNNFEASNINEPDFCYAENDENPSTSASENDFFSDITKHATKQISDDFIINDLGSSSRKRKSRESFLSQAKRKDKGSVSHPTKPFFGPIDDDEPIRRRSLSSPPKSPISAGTAMEHNIAPTQDLTRKQHSVEISFLDNNSEHLRKNILTALESSATVAVIRERCQKSLMSHQKDFIICLEDDTEVDPDMPLSMLVNDKDRLKFKCVVQKPTAQILFQCYNQDIQFEKDIVDKLRCFSLPNGSEEINFSQTEIDYCIQPLFRSLVDCSKPMKILNLNFAKDLGKSDVFILQSLFTNCQELSIAACNITDALLISISQAGASFNNLAKLDISYNLVTASGIAPFLATSPSLRTLIMKGLNLQGQCDLLSQLFCGLVNLEDLCIGMTQMPSSVLEHIFSSCNQLVNLDISSIELDFSFSQCWLPSLKSLRMPACIIHKWESFIDWISIGSVEYLDLSCTSITNENIIYLCERRIDTPILTIRLMRCPRVEHNIETLKDTILMFLQSRRCFVRLHLPSNISRMLKLETALASEFLSD